MEITLNMNNVKFEGTKLTVDFDTESAEFKELLNKIKGNDKKLRKLGDCKPGDIINDKYIVLSKYYSYNDMCFYYSVIRKDLLSNKMEFGKSNNNWIESNLRKYLNSKDGFLGEIEAEFGVDNIVSHNVDLLSMDGLDDYDKSEDKVSLLTIDGCRKYRKFLTPIDKWWWLATPNSTPSGWSSDYVCYVGSYGGVSYTGYNYDLGVRPFFVLKSDVMVY